MQQTELAIIGAGPYGLSAAAFLRAAGIEHRIFGTPMQFWTEMPAGMLLRSEWDGSHIAGPRGAFTLDEYERAQGHRLPLRMSMEAFANYGEWFQRNAVPDVDSRHVTRLERAQDAFVITLSDGESIHTRRAVVATGLSAFPRLPAQLMPWLGDVVTHTSMERNLARHAGKRVAVIGAGQSALECAALLHEAGADVEVLTRASRVNWLAQAGHISRESGRLAHLLYPPGAVGPLGVNWVVQLPVLYRALPDSLRAAVFARALRPAGSGWLKPRLDGVSMSTGVSITGAEIERGCVRLDLSDGGRRSFDHVLCATGYAIEVDRFPFLDPALSRAVARIGGQPRLGPGFESSVPGLHFLGAAADLSFGPLMRFVAGTGYAASALTRQVRRAAPARRATVVPRPATAS